MKYCGQEYAFAVEKDTAVMKTQYIALQLKTDRWDIIDSKGKAKYEQRVV